MEKNRLKIVFVKKSNRYDADIDVSSLKNHSAIGVERANHKYIKRENLGNGQYRYIYEQSKGNKTPSSKDSELMIEDFKNIMNSDNNWRRFVKYFDYADFSNITQALSSRGVDITPESFIEELNNVKNYLGVKVSNYIPTQISADEYKKMFSLAGSRPSEYNKIITNSLENGNKNNLTEINASIKLLNQFGFDENKLSELMKDPKKIKEIINIMQDVYNNISG
jgi:hypothetical protein